MKNKTVLLTLAIGLTGAVMVGCTTDNKENPPENQIETSVDENKEEVNISKFIPNGSYKTVFEGSDMANELQSIKGDGTTYEAIGVSGKGYYREIFKVIDNQLCFIEKEDLEDIENISDKEIVVDETLGNYKVVLKAKTDKTDTIQIAETGKDLKLKNLELKGDYIKVVEDVSTDEAKTIIETYYSEGLGVVKYEVIMDGNVMEFSELVSYEEIK